MPRGGREDPRRAPEARHRHGLRDLAVRRRDPVPDRSSRLTRERSTRSSRCPSRVPPRPDGRRGAAREVEGPRRDDARLPLQGPRDLGRDRAHPRGLPRRRSERARRERTAVSGPARPASLTNFAAAAALSRFAVDGHVRRLAAVRRRPGPPRRTGRVRRRPRPPRSRAPACRARATLRGSRPASLSAPDWRCARASAHAASDVLRRRGGRPSSAARRRRPALAALEEERRRGPRGPARSRDRDRSASRYSLSASFQRPFRRRTAARFARTISRSGSAAAAFMSGSSAASRSFAWRRTAAYSVRTDASFGGAAAAVAKTCRGVLEVAVGAGLAAERDEPVAVLRVHLGRPAERVERALPVLLRHVEVVEVEERRPRSSRCT